VTSELRRTQGKPSSRPQALGTFRVLNKRHFAFNRPGFSFLLSSPLRKSSRKLKRFIKDQWVSRRQLVKVRRRLHIWKEGEREGRGPGRMSFGSPVT